MLSTLLVQVPAAHAAGSASNAEDPAAVSEGQKALAEAEESGKRVEVVGERTERTTVFANPDGSTFTLQESSVPVRVAKPGGGWQAPDPTLEQRADGRVVPKAAAPQMVFSGGGEKDPLVRISYQGKSVELSWPSKLPVPKLDGASATYANVLPDVDLKVTATVESFQQVLVVKTPKAAADAELKKLTFGLKTTGLKVEEGGAGNLAAVDADGKAVFKSPPARMWNSSGDPTPPQAKTSAARSTASEDAPSDPAESAPSGSGLEPGQGDQVAKMDVEVGKDSLQIVPDADLLAEKDTNAFPLFIDPSVTWGESERTLLRSDGYESYAWGNGDDDMGKGAGKCGTWTTGGVTYGCGPGYVQKLYYEFSPASLKGKHVLDATFRVTEPWAFQCDPRSVDLVRTNNISSSTTWSSRPKELDRMGDRSVSAGRGDLCSPGLPNAAIEFNDNPEEADENLTPTVKNFAAGKFSRLTLEVRAHDEDDTAAWKRFRNDAVLEVDFVGLPDKPTGVGLVTGSGTVCETHEKDPAIVSDPTPALTATAQTKPGGEKDAQLRAYFDIDHKKSDGTWADTPTTAADVRPSTGYVGDNSKLTMSWSVLTEGTLYRYGAWVRSYYNDGKSYLTGPSSASTGWCYFKVDPTAPKAPKISIGDPYSECLPNNCLAKGGPGQAGRFTFAPADGDTTNTAYQYKLSSQVAWNDILRTCDGGISQFVCFTLPVTDSRVRWRASITPKRAGTYQVYARAKDSVGRWGAQNSVAFQVAGGTPPVARYHFDEADGAAIDAAAGDGKDDATLAAGATRDSRGRRGLMTHDAQGRPLATPVEDTGLALKGDGGYAATNGPVLDTINSYTVAAWVRVDPSLTGTVSVLSQTPSTASPWTKKYSPFVISYGNKWSVRVFSTTGDFAREAVEAENHPKGVWTHVAAVHDTVAKKVTLYINGKQAAEVDAGTPWKAEGNLEIGRVMYGDTYVDSFKGAIDEVTAWQRALEPTEVQDEARLLTSDTFAGTELIADWNPTRGVNGTSVKDTTSGYGKSLALAGGASVADETIVLDGVDDAATAAGPLVEGTGSFTASTLVQLDEQKLLTKDVGYIGQVAGQRTADGSAWGLWFQVTGKRTELTDEGDEVTVPEGLWHFGRLESDGTFSSVTSEQAASVDSPVRLTGVHDSVDGTISLYLGYAQNGDSKAYIAKMGDDEFAVGKAYSAGAWKHFLPAAISEVRVWAGAMASSEQIETTVGD
ncbi:LamG domain-containing protein [Streptomyces sp. NBC_01231]|nr:LamG domain-containing protein [Streptomyces sp. NBC_01231]